MGKMDVGHIGEWKLIELIRAKLDLPSSEEILVDIGDDAACVRLEGLSLLTTDSYVQDVHFDPRHYNFYEIGYRCLACSLSDVAAMGGKPRFVLISLQLPPHTTVLSVEQLYSGLLELASKFDFRIVGGDTVRAKDIGLVCTVIGWTDRAVERSGAKAGDAICVTGELGSSSLGLHLLNLESQRPECAPFVQTHKRPVPRINEGRILASSQVVNAMIDISDGLALDLHHLTEESRVGAVIHYESLPINGELKALAEECGSSPLDFVLYGGEDYELLFTLPSSEKDRIAREVEVHTGTRITEIGHIVAEKKIQLEKNGKLVPLPRRGYDHFRN